MVPRIRRHGWRRIRIWLITGHRLRRTLSVIWVSWIGARDKNGNFDHSSVINDLIFLNEGGVIMNNVKSKFVVAVLVALACAATANAIHTTVVAIQEGVTGSDGWAMWDGSISFDQRCCPCRLQR